jgi:hypothetical protein
VAAAAGGVYHCMGAMIFVAIFALWWIYQKPGADVGSVDLEGVGARLFDLKRCTAYGRKTRGRGLQLCPRGPRPTNGKGGCL